MGLPTVDSLKKTVTPALATGLTMVVLYLGYVEYAEKLGFKVDKWATISQVHAMIKESQKAVAATDSRLEILTRLTLPSVEVSLQSPRVRIEGMLEKQRLQGEGPREWQIRRLSEINRDLEVVQGILDELN